MGWFKFIGGLLVGVGGGLAAALAFLWVVSRLVG
jgi:hypothetical protein